jgi:hypothetical protein
MQTAFARRPAGAAGSPAARGGAWSGPAPLRGAEQSALKSVFKEWYPDMEVEVVPEAAESPGSPYSRSLRPEHQAASRVGAR